MQRVRAEMVEYDALQIGRSRISLRHRDQHQRPGLGGRLGGHLRPRGNGFLWENGRMYLGSDLIPPQPSGLRVEDTFYINDRGEIYGVGVLPDGDEQAIVLEPAHRSTTAASIVSPSGNGTGS